MHIPATLFVLSILSSYVHAYPPRGFDRREAEREVDMINSTTVVDVPTNTVTSLIVYGGSDITSMPTSTISSSGSPNDALDQADTASATTTSTSPSTTAASEEVTSSTGAGTRRGLPISYMVYICVGCCLGLGLL